MLLAAENVWTNHDQPVVGPNHDELNIAGVLKEAFCDVIVNKCACSAIERMDPLTNPRKLQRTQEKPQAGR